MNCLQLKIIHMPKWHTFWGTFWGILFPFNSSFLFHCWIISFSLGNWVGTQIFWYGSKAKEIDLCSPESSLASCVFFATDNLSYQWLSELSHQYNVCPQNNETDLTIHKRKSDSLIWLHLIYSCSVLPWLTINDILCLFSGSLRKTDLFLIL